MNTLKNIGLSTLGYGVYEPLTFIITELLIQLISVSVSLLKK